MAIYNNREVSFLAPVRASHQVEHITIVYNDGTHENVPAGRVKFTESEKKQLVKDYPSQFEDIQTIPDDDIKAVRLGVAPSSDPSYRQQAEAQVLHQKQIEENQKQVDAAKAEAKKSIDKKVNQGAKIQNMEQAPTGVYQGKAK